MLRGKQSHDLCVGNGAPAWPTDLTEFFVHWECLPLKEGVRTVPQFVFKLVVTTTNSAIKWKNLREHCGCELTLYSLRHLSQKTFSHNKWHFSETKIPVGVSCDNWNTALCNDTLLNVENDLS